MTRFPDWRPRLRAYVSSVSRETFAFGRHDCALFAAGAVAAMTGVDPAAAWRGRYRTAADGLNWLRVAGYADPFALAGALFEEVPAAFAQIGDLAEVPGEDGPALGVVQGAAIYVIRREGLATVPLTTASRAWRV